MPFRSPGIGDPTFVHFPTEMPSPSPRPAINLSLANPSKSVVDRLLADIPALSVGLLGFAVLTFFVILKKVRLAPLLLFSAVIFTFFAAIFDLARISFKHENSSSARKGTGKITGTLVDVREALSSVAFGLRFLYFWAFVAQAPPCEQGADSFLRLHSGSWIHWGLTGTVLRWTTFLASIAILVLQLLWRIVKALRFGTVYNVESALEITASGIYIIKLILNATIVEEPCRRQTLWQYTTAFVALLINLGIGVGNLLNFRFSETPLGRLLLAIELYILIVMTMVFAFYSRGNTTIPLPQSHDKRASSFRGLHVSFYDTDLGLVGQDNTNPSGPPRSPAQRSSSWLTWNAPERRSSQVIPSSEDGRASRSEAEAGRGITSSLSDTRAPFVLDDIQPSSLGSSFSDAITRGISEGFSSPPIQSLAGPLSGPAAAAVLTTSPDSPTLGPDGHREARESSRPSRKPKQESDGSIASSQLSGFENLLRQQTELERSIAALRTMFAPGQSGEESRDENPDSLFGLPERNKYRESTATAYGPTSASGRSDFSLSVFPEPPQVPRITGNLSRYGPRSSSVPDQTPTQMSFDIGRQVFPVSTEEGEAVAVSAFGRRTESAGTHYDVTSFIGDLTFPDHRTAAQIAMYLKDSDAESEADSADLATIVTIERKPSNGVISRPHLVDKASLAPERPSSASGSTIRVPSARGAAADPPSRRYSPTSDLRSPPKPAAFNRAPSARPLTPSGRVVGLPPRPKLDVSLPGDQ